MKTASLAHVAIILGLLFAAASLSAKEFRLSKINPRLKIDLPDDFTQEELSHPLGYRFTPPGGSGSGAITIEILPQLYGPNGRVIPPIVGESSPTIQVGHRKLRFLKTVTPNNHGYMAAILLSEVHSLTPEGDAYLVIGANAPTDEMADHHWHLLATLNLPTVPSE